MLENENDVEIAVKKSKKQNKQIKNQGKSKPKVPV